MDAVKKFFGRNKTEHNDEGEQEGATGGAADNGDGGARFEDAEPKSKGARFADAPPTSPVKKTKDKKQVRVVIDDEAGEKKKGKLTHEKKKAQAPPSVSFKVLCGIVVY